ncbi:MAG: pH-response regulator protein palA/rim20 [Bogoriella megaspora]|nr:MAG: pH-response regulator protein palA/rim20 [Bogoriella megaspora]
MTSNILFLPFRRTHAVSLSEAIKQYISSKYDQHPDMFATDLEEVDRLRSSAVHALEPHSSGVRKIQAYAAQLVWMGGKFPIDIGADFTWYTALGYNTSNPVSQNNLRYELANILFNLAAMYSQLAMSANRATPDGLKSAANYFCLAAGVVSHIKNTVIPDMRSTPPEDMDNMTMESLEYLLLAQSQELFWQKAVKDGLKDASIAKLAAKVSDLYSDAQDYGIKSDSISSEWIHHMSAKHHHFAAAAQFRAACDCLEKRKYGEEVARLRDSVTCVNEALKEARYLNKAVLGDLNGLRNKVSDDLKTAEKDNDTIYLLPIPSKSDLKMLDRASMVATKIPLEVSEPISMLGENGELGRPLFSKLVPYSVHVAASIYADRKDRVVNNTIIEELENLTSRLHDLLQSLNLPGSLQALEKPLGLPPTLVSHAEEIRQVDGITRIQRAVAETEKLRTSDRALYDAGVEALRVEAAEDEQARRRHGTERWTRLKSNDAAPQLYEQNHEIDGYFKTATTSDNLVREKFKEHERLIRLLSGTNRDLEDFVPSSRRATMTAKLEREASRLRGCLNEVSRLETKRKRKIEALRAKAKNDDINPDLLKEAARLERESPMQKVEAAQFEDFFEIRLRRYDTDAAGNKEEQNDQDDIANRLQAANSAFVEAKKGDSSSKERERALQSLDNAYYKYKEIISNLDGARKFYNDLAKIVGRFRDDCHAFNYNRRTELSNLENDLSSAMSGLHLNQGGNPQLDALQQQRQSQIRQQQQVNATMGRSAQEEPIPAPMPQRPPNGPPQSTPVPVTGTWNPEMGIKFAAVTTPMSGANAQQGQPRDGRWDPSQGLRFG